jgi:hypothetical protein
MVFECAISRGAFTSLLNVISASKGGDKKNIMKKLKNQQ